MLLNFDSEQFKLNESALENAHLGHFLSDNICQSYSSLFCFTKTNINDSPVKHIVEVLDDWKDIHKNTQHGLALCYKVNKVNIIEVIDIPSNVEILPIVLEINKETFLLVIVYRAPGPVGFFIDEFIFLMNELPIQYRILIVGDFNFDQMLPENVANIAHLIQSFDPSQRSQYSTHIHGGILDLNSNIVYVLPWPCSDHFVLFFPNLRARYLNLRCQHYPHNTARYYDYGHFKCLVEIELVKNSETLKYFFFFQYTHVVYQFINRFKRNYKQENHSSQV